MSEIPHVVPYWRLSRFYFFYYAVLGAAIPYWSLFLKEAGFTAQAIGWLTAMLAATRIISPNIWGWVADRSQQRIKVIQLRHRGQNADVSTTTPVIPASAD